MTRVTQQDGREPSSSDVRGYDSLERQQMAAPRGASQRVYDYGHERQPSASQGKCKWMQQIYI